jgi:AAHS family 3-hydroxyphenylpropionic acid transporter
MVPASNLENASLGWVFSASTLGLLIGAIIGGYCADRIGRKRVLIVSMLLLGVFSLGTTLCSDLYSLLWMRLLTGLGLGGAMPNLIALAAENSPDASRGRWVALMYAGIPMGSALASLIALSNDDWRAVFWVGAAAPLLVAPLMSWVLPESQCFESVRNRGMTGQGSYLALLGANQLLTTILIWITACLTLLVIYSVFNWLPTLLLGLGLRAEQVSASQLTLGLGGVIGALVIGVLLDSRWRTLSLGIVYGTAALLLFCLANAPAQVAVIVALALLMGIAMQSTTAILFFIAPLCYETAHRSTGVGASVAAGRIGAIAGPIVVGSMIASGADIAGVMLSMMPVMLFAMMCATWVTWRAERLGRALR